MSLVVSLQAVALGVHLEQSRQAFSVDGESETFWGQLDGPSGGNALSVVGFMPAESASLVIQKPCNWTPTVGKRVTARGITYTVRVIADEQNHWILTLEGKDQ